MVFEVSLDIIDFRFYTYQSVFWSRASDFANNFSRISCVSFSALLVIFKMYRFERLVIAYRNIHWFICFLGVGPLLYNIRLLLFLNRLFLTLCRYFHTTAIPWKIFWQSGRRLIFIMAVIIDWKTPAKKFRLSTLWSLGKR